MDMLAFTYEDSASEDEEEPLVHKDADEDPDAPPNRNQFLLVVAFVTFTGFAIGEILGGIFGHSLSLTEDASTMIVDSITYAINGVAEKKKKGASPRTVLLWETVSPAFSAIALIATTIYITIAAAAEVQPGYESTDDTNVTVMWIFTSINAVIDVVNIVLFVREARKHRKHHEKMSALAEKRTNANMLSAFTHIIIDSMRTAAVFGAAASTKFGVKPYLADAYCSFVVTGLTIVSTLPLFRALFKKIGQLRALPKRTQTKQKNFGPLSVQSDSVV